MRPVTFAHIRPKADGGIRQSSIFGNRGYSNSAKLLIKR